VCLGSSWRGNDGRSEAFSGETPVSLMSTAMSYHCWFELVDDRDMSCSSTCCFFAGRMEGRTRQRAAQSLPSRSLSGGWRWCGGRWEDESEEEEEEQLDIVAGFLEGL